MDAHTPPMITKLVGIKCFRGREFLRLQLLYVTGMCPDGDFEQAPLRSGIHSLVIASSKFRMSPATAQKAASSVESNVASREASPAASSLATSAAFAR